MKFIFFINTVVDYVHARIELEARKEWPTPVSHPNQWKEIIRKSSVSRPFEQIDLKREEIRNWHFKYQGTCYASMFPEMKWSKGASWKLTKNSIEVRDTFISENVKKYESNALERIYRNFNPPLAYTSVIPLPFSKKEALISFIGEGIIPLSYIDYYALLPVVEPKGQSWNALLAKIRKLQVRYHGEFEETDEEDTADEVDGDYDDNSDDD